MLCSDSKFNELKLSDSSEFSKTSSTLEITSLISDLISVAISLVIPLTYASISSESLFMLTLLNN